MPEIEQHYRVAPYKIFAGHSFGGLLAVDILITRPDIYQAYIAASPSLWWDNQSTLHRAQDFFADDDQSLGAYKDHLKSDLPGSQTVGNSP